MSSSGKGQSVIRGAGDVAGAWAYAQQAGRTGAGRVIVEAFVDFDYEITLLTIRHAGGTSFCAPIGHLQEDGDYRESWQPHAMSDGRARRRPRAGPAGDRRARRDRDLRRRAVRVRRRGPLQRGLAAPARHRHDDDGDPGAERVRAARARDPRPAGAGRRGAAAVAGRVGGVPGDRAGRRAGHRRRGRGDGGRSERRRARVRQARRAAQPPHGGGDRARRGRGRRTGDRARRGGLPARRLGLSAEDRLDRHADDLQAAGQARQREGAQLLGACAERAGVRAVGGLQGVGDGGQQVDERRAHDVREPRVDRDGLLEKPRAVGDVAVLVVVDARVSLAKAREQTLALEHARRELEGRQPQRPLQDLVVDRDEGDLRRDVARIGDEALVRGDEPVVEERAKGVGDLRAGAGHVLGDHRRPRDDVLKARVELHVACLVDLLGGEEGRLLLAGVRTDEPGELRRDALLGDHERAEDELDQRPVGDRRPLLGVRAELDLERVPLRPLPVDVERLRVVQRRGSCHPMHPVSRAIGSG